MGVKITFEILGKYEFDLIFVSDKKSFSKWLTEALVISIGT